MRFTEATSRKVVSTSTAETVGQIADFVIDPRSHTVVAVTVKKTDAGDTVLWPRITAFGTDAVTVAGAEAVVDANDVVADLASKDHRLLGKRILTTAGEDLGPVTDVEFDPTSGAVVAVIAATGEIAGGRLIGIGSYAAIVHDGA